MQIENQMNRNNNHNRMSDRRSNNNRRNDRHSNVEQENRHFNTMFKKMFLDTETADVFFVFDTEKSASSQAVVVGCKLWFQTDVCPSRDGPNRF